MNVEVASVSKEEQRISKVAAAVHVISQVDIRRSGATNIRAAGVGVTQIRADGLAISALGLNGVFANTLLIPTGGRTAYRPVCSAALKFMREVQFEDIERIEALRRRGTKICGANAVINIITKGSEQTLGGVIEASTCPASPGRGWRRTAGPRAKAAIAAYSPHRYRRLQGGEARQGKARRSGFFQRSDIWRKGLYGMGGAVTLTVRNNKVDGGTNADAAERSRLKISSELLNLAKAVVRRVKN